MKWLLRYLRGTSNTSLCYGNGKVVLQGFVDADLSGDVDSSKSRSGYIYTDMNPTSDHFHVLERAITRSNIKKIQVSNQENNGVADIGK